MFRLRLPPKAAQILIILTALLARALATPNSESIDIDTLANIENRLGGDGPEQPTSAAPPAPAALDLPQLWRLLAKIEHRQDEFDGEIKILAAALNRNLDTARQEWSRTAAKRQADIEQTGHGLRKLRQDMEVHSMKLARLSSRLGEIQSAANESLAKASGLQTALRAADGNAASLRTQQNQMTTSLNALTRFTQETRAGLSARIGRLESLLLRGRPLPPTPLPWTGTTTTRTTTRAPPIYWASSPCGGRFTTPTGQLRYPDTGLNYPPNKHCTWTISAPVGKHVVIRFQRFSLEDESSCQSDYLEIRNGHGVSLHKFCGHEIPLNGHPISASGAVSLIFRSDSTIAFSGFQLTWEFANQAVDPPPPPVCGGSLGAEGALKYPQFGNYPNNQECNWTFTAPEGKLIRLQFTRIRMQFGIGCPTDWLKVQTEGNTLAKYCSANFQGTSVPFISLNSTMNVHFHSDWWGTGAGFELLWRSIEADGVNRMYFHNADWAHTLVLPGRDARVSSSGGDPRRQHLAMVYEFLNSTAVTRVTVQASATVCPDVVGPTCKYENTATFNTATNRSWVMKSDGVHAQKQGSMDLSEVDPEGPVYPWTVTPGYGGSFNTSSGTLRHPPAGVSLYEQNESCSWTITVPEGQRVNLRFQSFELEPNDFCSYDWLEVRDVNADRLLGKFCGYSLPRGGLLESTGNQLSLRFRSDASGQRSGFQLTWTAVGAPMVEPLSSTVETATVHTITVGNANNATVVAVPMGSVADTVTGDFDLVEDGNQRNVTRPSWLSLLQAYFQQIRANSTLDFGSPCSHEMELNRRAYMSNVTTASLIPGGGGEPVSVAGWAELQSDGGHKYCNHDEFLTCGASNTCECGSYLLNGFPVSMVRENNTCRFQAGSICLPSDLNLARDFPFEEDLLLLPFSPLAACQEGSTCIDRANRTACSGNYIFERLWPLGTPIDLTDFFNLMRFVMDYDSQVCECTAAEASEK